MLDEDDNQDLLETMGSSQEKDLFRNLEFEHTKRLREVRQKPQQTLKVSKDIYNTLHTMGQFLTKMDMPQGANIPIKKSMTSAKAQKLEQIASSIRVQEIELPPTATQEERMSALCISKADEIKEINQPINLPTGEKEQVLIEQVGSFGDTKRIDTVKLEAMAIELEYGHQEVQREPMEQEIQVLQEEETINSDGEVQSAFSVDDEGVSESYWQVESEQIEPLDEISGWDNDIEAQIESSYKQISQGTVQDQDVVMSIEEGLRIRSTEEELYLNSLGSESEMRHTLDQNSIDNIVSSFFGSKQPQYAFSRELKKHIEKQITAIRNYK